MGKKNWCVEKKLTKHKTNSFSRRFLGAFSGRRHPHSKRDAAAGYPAPLGRVGGRRSAPSEGNCSAATTARIAVGGGGDGGRAPATTPHRLPCRPPSRSPRGIHRRPGPRR